MASIIQALHRRGLIKPPPFVVGGVQYETVMGSLAYGVSTDASDKDVYGFCVPPKHIVFPHTAGKIWGFSSDIERFEQWQQHHVCDRDAGKEYDLTIFSIVKYFRLLMENNPNVLDSLFTREACVLHTTKIANMVRDNRKLFLSRRLWHTFKGYAFSQLHKIETKKPDPDSKRYWMLEKFGYDVKFAYHVVRLINEAEQLLREGDMDIMRDREILKSVRRGEWRLGDIRAWFHERETSFQKLYETSPLPYAPDEAKITRLLLDCLEEHYGNLDGCVESGDKYKEAVAKIKELVDEL